MSDPLADFKTALAADLHRLLTEPQGCNSSTLLGPCERLVGHAGRHENECAWWEGDGRVVMMKRSVDTVNVTVMASDAP